MTRSYNLIITHLIIIKLVSISITIIDIKNAKLMLIFGNILLKYLLLS